MEFSALIRSVLFFLIFSSFQPSQHVLYLIHKKEVKKALEEYQKLQSHDFSLLREIAYLILKEGIKNKDPDIQKLSLYGAGMAASDDSFSILEKGIKTNDPEAQMIALHFLSVLQDDRANPLFIDAMSSDFLMTRIEAAYYLTEKKHPAATGQLESLMHRLPQKFKPFFPPFFAMMGTKEATAILKDFFNDRDPNVRIETLISIGEFKRDDLLYLVKKSFSHANIGEKESCVSVLGKLNDASSIQLLEKTIHDSDINTKLAAAYALYLLKNPAYVSLIEKAAGQCNPFAIHLLGKMEGRFPILYSLLKHQDQDVRFNAAVSLLLKKDPKSLPILESILFSNDIGIQPQYSIGRSLMSWKLYYSLEKRNLDPHFQSDLSFQIKDYLLQEISNLPEKEFISFAKKAIQLRQKKILPKIIYLLENLNTKASVDLLKEGAKQLGFPLLRDYCHLSLYRLKQEDASYIYEWTEKTDDEKIIHLRPYTPKKIRIPTTNYELTVEETSRLFLEMYNALASSHTEKAIDIIISSIKNKNPKNRYILAGLLLRTIA